MQFNSNMIRTCLYGAVRISNQPNCPICKQQVQSVTPAFGMGRERGSQYTGAPPRPLPGVDPFSNLIFGDGPPRRSARQRTTNRRLTGELDLTFDKCSYVLDFFLSRLRCAKLRH